MDMVSICQGPHPRRAFGRRGCMEDAAHHDAISEHVVIVLAPFAGWARSRRAFENQLGHGSGLLGTLRERPSAGVRYSHPPWTAIAELADIPAQPCGRNCGDRSVRGSNLDLRAAVCLSCCRPWTAATAVVCGDPQPVGGVADSTDGRGIPVEHGAHLFGARQ